MDNFHYFGLFLDTNTKNKLMNILTDNIDYNIALNVADKIFIDHCTLLHVSQLHGNSEVFNDLNNKLGDNIQIKIDGIGISDKAMADEIYIQRKDNDELTTLIDDTLAFIKLENSQWFFERLFQFNENTKIINSYHCEQCGDTVITRSLTINIED